MKIVMVIKPDGEFRPYEIAVGSGGGLSGKGDTKAAAIAELIDNIDARIAALKEIRERVQNL